MYTETVAINWLIIVLLIALIGANVFQWRINRELYAEKEKLKKNFIRALAQLTLANRLKDARSDPEGD